MTGQYIAAFDIGTTAAKGVLLRQDGSCVCEKSVELETVFLGDWKEQRPQDWYAAFCEIGRFFFSQGIDNEGGRASDLEEGQRIDPAQIRGIIMSGQMQDLIPVDREFLPCGNAILYSDGRAGKEADCLAALIGREQLEEVTGNHFDGSLPFPKLLWLSENRREDYEQAYKVLFSSKDYVIARLTGCFAADVTAASTAGLMDIHSKTFVADWMTAAGLDPGKLPPLHYADQKVGLVTEKAASESGFLTGTPVYAGTGDAGATTLASGISHAGEFNINLGTSGWVACVSDDILKGDGVFNLAAMPRDEYINVVPFLNAGNVHNWISGVLASEPESPTRYEQLHQLLLHSEPGSHGVMFLPYLAGERFPVMDEQIKGGFVNLTPQTGKQDLARAALEGVAFSIRQGIERIGRKPTAVSVIGGGARESVWCKILADVLGHPICAYGDSEYLPSMAIAAAVMLDQGDISDYGDFTASLQKSEDSRIYEPEQSAVEKYNQIYPQYLRLYGVLKQLNETVE